jgi:DNA-binding CsgD family transcriptional regulator
MDWQAHEGLASLELSAGRIQDAYAHLEQVRRPETLDLFGEPMFLRWFVGDEIEVLVGVGRSDESEPLVRWLAERGNALDRPITLALAERGRGLLCEAVGDLDQAERALLRALDHHHDLPIPFDRARTLLILGRVRRRLGKKRAARDALEEATGIFEHIGARLWLERARAETEMISGRRSVGMALSDAEERVAPLAAAGRTNKEIAVELSLSVRTVEGHLSRIYEKLGVRGRSELAASWLSTDARQ